jgi:WD40 repeat protein
MEKSELACLRSVLLNDSSGFDSDEWNSAVERLILDGSEEALHIVSQAIKANRGKVATDVVTNCVRRLADAGHADAVYYLWLIDRDPRITALLTEGGWKSDFASCTRVFSWLESGKLDELKAGVADVVAPLIDAAETGESIIRDNAVQCLEELSRREAVDELCARWLQSRSPLLDRLIRDCRYVAENTSSVRVFSALAAGRTALLTDEGPDALEPLLAACKDSDAFISESAKKCLYDLRNPDAIDAFCDCWAQNRNPELGDVILQAGYVALRPIDSRVLSALKADKVDALSHDATSELLHPLIRAAEDDDPEISIRAATLLEEVLQASDARETLCSLVVEHGSSLAQAIALEKGCEPSDTKDLALFYFLTEQWDNYEALDFDMSMLREAYERGGKQLRARIAQRARRAGRLELVELVSGARHKRHMGEMTSREWEVTFTIVDGRQDWETMWRFVQSAPAVWAVRALGRLGEVGWLPAAEGDRNGFADLSRLAKHCDSEAPILGVMDRPMASFKAHGGRVTALIVSSYFERTLATGSWDRTTRIWSMPEGKPLETLRGPVDPVTCLAATADGAIMAGGCGADRNVILWNMAEAIPFAVLPGHEKGVACLAVSPDGRYLAAGGHDKSCRLWRLRDRKLSTRLTGHERSVRCAAFSPDGSILATSSDDRTIRLWSVPDGEALAVLSGHTRAVRSLVFSPAGRMLASGGSDDDVILWEMPGGRLIRRLHGHTDVVGALAVSGDGRVLASGSHDRTVRLWILPDGKAWGTLEEHSAAVTSLATDPESRVLVSGGHDCTVNMWNFQSGIFRRPTFREDLDRVESLQITSFDLGTQAWIDFLKGQMKWRWRFDIELDGSPTTIEVGEFDILVEV